MEIEDILKQLEQMSRSPDKGSEDYSRWLDQTDFLEFMINSADNDIPTYISRSGPAGGCSYSVIIKNSLLKGKYIEDLLLWHCPPDATWGYGYSHTKKGIAKPSTYPPFDCSRSKILSKGMPLTYLRSYEGKITDPKVYVEISQFITHLHSLHFDEPRNAYCRLNNEGDVEEIIKIECTPGRILTTIKKAVLDFHLFLSKSALVRFFDVHRYQDLSGFNPSSEKRKEEVFRDDKNEIYANRIITYQKNNTPDVGSLRGFQIIRNSQAHKKMLAILTGQNLKPKKYEKFIAIDWKNKRIAELSCNPKEFGSYFEQTNKPFAISPAFFKPEVLLKYKSDPDKYNLKHRSITCRNSWHLQTYDINEKGQVHTYLIYLSYLPHSEQLHWKQFNEKPKASIAKRAFNTDFMAQWDLSYDPLISLKVSLKDLAEVKSEIWSCKDENLLDQLNCVVTNSTKEWSDEIGTLDKLVVEGLKHSYLKKMAKSLKCYDPKLASIKLLEGILKAKDIDQNEIDVIIAPLLEIHYLRTKASAHAGGQEAKKIQSKLISEHKNLNSHFKDLLERTDQSIKALLELISRGCLDLIHDQI